MGFDIVIHIIGSWHKVTSRTGETVNSSLNLFRGQDFHLVPDRFGNRNRAVVHVLNKSIHANAHRTTVRTDVRKGVIHETHAPGDSNEHISEIGC